VIKLDKNKKKILVTSALPYANGSIHIGHLVEYIQTDIYVRFLKLIKEDVIYCCADDTHGTPIEINAKNQGISPEKLIEKYYKEHQEDFKKYFIEFDSYYSTNSEENKFYSDLIFNKLKDKNLIYTKDVENYYDEEAERFLPDRFVKGKCPKCQAEDQYGDVCEKCNSTYKPIDLIDPFSTLTGKKPILKKSKHYFFKLSSLSEKLDNWLINNKNLQPEVVKYVRNWIKDGIEDWDISRDGPYFGFKIPNEENKYYYVWMDAPIGYISSTANYCKLNKDKNLEVKDYWNKDARIIHFIGKDISYFHFLFWPAMLMESDFNLPEAIKVHGFLTVNNEKMSKSRGTFITAAEFSSITNPEYLRFYYAYNLTSSIQDIDLDFDDFKSKINNELVSNIGNFVYRVLSFTEKNFDLNYLNYYDNELILKVNEYKDLIKEKYNKIEFREAVKLIFELSSIGNKYFQDNAPWKLIKENKEDAHKKVSSCVNLVRDLIILLNPIMPHFSNEILKQINQELDIDLLGKIKGGKINQPKIVLEKIDELEKPKNPFSILNLKVAQILEVEDHPEADKLYVLKLDLEKEKRQIVAGIKEHYKKEDLINKKIIIVSNLKYAKLRGIESQGMLLAASIKDKVVLVNPQDSVIGENVFIDDVIPSEDQIKIDDFFKIKLTVKDKFLVYDNQKLKTKTEDIMVDIEDNAIVK
jgi:methionyl-tRNA synthetase